MWAEEIVRLYTRRQIDKVYYQTPSAIVLKSFYQTPSGSGWRFDKMRAIVESEIKIYKQGKLA